MRPHTAVWQCPTWVPVHAGGCRCRDDCVAWGDWNLGAHRHTTCQPLGLHDHVRGEDGAVVCVPGVHADMRRWRAEGECTCDCLGCTYHDVAHDGGGDVATTNFDGGLAASVPPSASVWWDRWGEYHETKEDTGCLSANRPGRKSLAFLIRGLKRLLR